MYTPSISRRDFLKTSAALSFFVAATSIFDIPLQASAATPSICYTSHISNVGWQGAVADGAVSGTTGRSLGIECVRVDVTGLGCSGTVEVNAHVSGMGWQGWRGCNVNAGTTGQGCPVEALKFRLTGDAASRYSLRARGHMANIGWGSWCSGTEVSIGTTGEARPLEAFQLQIIQKGAIQAPLENMYICGNTWLEYYRARPSRPYHAGIDVASRNGNRTVMACAEGSVAASGYNSANGYYVVIRHTINGRQCFSFYCHLKSLEARNVSVGNAISAGTPIGIMGNTGSASAGLHLHFAIVSVCKPGSYFGYVDISRRSDAVTSNGCTYYNPLYVLQNGRLPD